MRGALTRTVTRDHHNASQCARRRPRSITGVKANGTHSPFTTYDAQKKSLAYPCPAT